MVCVYEDKENCNFPIAAEAEIVGSKFACEESMRQPTIIFNQPTSFLIKNDWFGCGDAVITGGPNNEAMFRMVRMGGSVLGKSNVMNINNMEGEPILSMREHRYGGGVAMELCQTDSSGQNPVPICRVVRKVCKMTIHDRYHVELVGSNAKVNYPTIDCKGHWPKKFTFLEAGKSGKQLASVQKTNIKKWQLNLSAGEDVLFFLGIACAIDRISHECKQRKATFFAIGAAVNGVAHSGH